MSKLEKRLLGIKDSRGPKGIFSRGANVYRGGAPSAHSGGPNIGRPSKAAIRRRMGKR